MAAWARWLRKGAMGVSALALFVLALELIKAASRVLGPFVRDTLRVTNEASALGFGWILSAVVLSGSPVAALALAFFAGGVVNEIQALLMITGSRLGASLVILALAILYHVRGKKESTSLEVGILAVLVTFSIYLPAAVLGWVLLKADALAWATVAPPSVLVDLLDVAYGPIVDLATAYLPRLAVAALGIATLVLSIQLFDRALPDVALLGTRTRSMVERVFRPAVMLAVGAFITSFTLSVSVSLGLLVPLAAKGYVRRENLVPYILGANITTFIDTLFASLLVAHPAAFTIVLAEIVAVSAMTFTMLFFFYQSYERTMLRMLDRVLASNVVLGILVASLVIAPVLLMLVR